MKYFAKFLWRVTGWEFNKTWGKNFMCLLSFSPLNFSLSLLKATDSKEDLTCDILFHLTLGIFRDLAVYRKKFNLIFHIAALRRKLRSGKDWQPFGFKIPISL